MRYYIDPGTGSMLFAILIGIIGAINYVARMAIVKIRFILSGGKKVEFADKLPLVFFSDHKRYWNVFKPLCEELDRRGIDVVYMTASPDDPGLECGLKHVKGEFVGEGNMAFAKLNFLKANVVVSTTPGLDVYQWKRSKEVACYIHILHAAGEVVEYRMFGVDYYDALVLAGDYQVRQIRELEAMRGLPEKEIVLGGIPYMDEMVRRLKESENDKVSSPTSNDDNDTRTVLLAPSWGPSSIFNKFGEKIIEDLLATGYNIIIRPHPQSFSSEKELIDKLMQMFPESENLSWNRDVDNFGVLKKSDILISDFSGVTYDFALVYDKPIIYADTEFDKAPYDAWWLKDEELWTMTALPRMGMKLSVGDDIKSLIDECLNNPRFAEGRDEVRRECWSDFGNGTKATVDFIVKKLEEVG